MTSLAAPARITDVRAEILAVATRLFATQGFDGTSLQQIAEQVGVRKPSLLYHFASKEELRQAVLEELLARWNETLPRLLLAVTAGEDQFTVVTRSLLDFLSEDPNRARLIVREALDRPTDMRERLARHLRPVVANLSLHVKQGQRRGLVHGDADAEAYLFQIISFFICGVAFTDSFASLMPRRAPEGAPRERLMRELSRIARSALFRTPAAASRSRDP